MNRKFTLFAFFLIFAHIGCNKTKIDTKSFQHALVLQEQQADKMLVEIQHTLNSSTPDSVINFILKQNTDILFYFFNGNDLIFWSDNWLVANQIKAENYNKWFFQQFENAYCVCKWSSINFINVLTIIPIKYNFSFENEELTNEFLPAFKFDKSIDIIYNPKHTNAIYSNENEYMFSLCMEPEHSNAQAPQTRIADSFSYSQLLTSGNSTAAKNRYLAQTKIRIYFIIGIILIVLCLGFCIYHIYKRKGFRNLKLSYKFEFMFVILLLLSFVYVFVTSINYVRERYEVRQKADLQRKTVYIQKALQEMYFWNQSLNATNTASLNIDLRDLSYTYETDIHVYDTRGVLVGSSQAAIFEKGLISNRISPKPYFSANPTLTQYERIGKLEYLSAYTDFNNGDYVPMGYIAVPLFISSEEIAAEIDALLSKLIPIYLAVILLSIIVSMILGRQLTAPISMIENKLKDIKVGKPNERIDYKPSDEIGHLVAQYNLMVDKLDESAQLLAKSERENAWKTMARQIAHEINNPLTPMKLTIQQLQRTKNMDAETFDNYFKKSTSLLIEQIDNLSRIAGMFSNFAKLPEIKLQKVDVAAKLNSVTTLFTNNNENKRIEYKGKETDIFATTDAEQITQVFNNLIKNAIQAINNKTDGIVCVSISEIENNMVEITVADNGVGISEEIRDKIFVPNFTTKSTGMGLGLAICKNIVESSGGTIGFETSAQETIFRVTLPQ